MTAIADYVRELIATGPYAHLTTQNEDGSPQVSVVGTASRLTNSCAAARFAGVGPGLPLRSNALPAEHPSFVCA